MTPPTSYDTSPAQTEGPARKAIAVFRRGQKLVVGAFLLPWRSSDLVGGVMTPPYRGADANRKTLRRMTEGKIYAFGWHRS